MKGLKAPTQTQLNFLFEAIQAFCAHPVTLILDCSALRGFSMLRTLSVRRARKLKREQLQRFILVTESLWIRKLAQSFVRARHAHDHVMICAEVPKILDSVKLKHGE